MQYGFKYSNDYTIMRGLEIFKAKKVSIAIRNEITRSKESRYDQQLSGLLLVSGGMIRHNARDISGEMG